MHYGEAISSEEVAACEERELVAEVERRVRACQTNLRRHARPSGKVET